jgi:glycosyltransferase involved in cell wall biosynthesis
MEPKISIVTPSFNPGAYIGQTVRSVLGQDYPNLEYIVMDGGSTDNTLRVLQPHIQYFHHFSSGPDQGQADAIATGFDKTSGDIMGYLNSDDMLAPGALHFVSAYFRGHPEVDFIYSHRCIVDTADRVIGYWYLPPHSDYLMQRLDLIPQETCFWRRSLFLAVGNVDRSYRFAMDYDLFVRMMRRGKFRRVNRILAVFRQHESSKTTQIYDTIGAEEIQTVRKKYGIRQRENDQIVCQWFWFLVDHASRRLANSNRSLPGAFCGVGYDYDDVWGGRLSAKLGQVHSRLVNGD